MNHDSGVDAPWPHIVLTNSLYWSEANLNPLLEAEVYDWCRENLAHGYRTAWAKLTNPNPNFYLAAPVIIFDDPNDAVLFTLRWGEQ